MISAFIICNVSLSVHFPNTKKKQKEEISKHFSLWHLLRCNDDNNINVKLKIPFFFSSLPR